MTDFQKIGAKWSLMNFPTTFVMKKIEIFFANLDFQVNPRFAALCHFIKKSCLTFLKGLDYILIDFMGIDYF